VTVTAWLVTGAPNDTPPYVTDEGVLVSFHTYITATRFVPVAVWEFEQVVLMQYGMFDTASNCPKANPAKSKAVRTGFIYWHPVNDKPTDTLPATPPYEYKSIDTMSYNAKLRVVKSLRPLPVR
jgi:hypothetical protein